MGKGGYSGGSTIIGPRSGWFGRSKSKAGGKRKKGDAGPPMSPAELKADRARKRQLDHAERTLRKTTQQCIVLRDETKTKLKKAQKVKKKIQASIRKNQAETEGANFAAEAAPRNDQDKSRKEARIRKFILSVPTSR